MKNYFKKIQSDNEIFNEDVEEIKRKYKDDPSFSKINIISSIQLKQSKDIEIFINETIYTLHSQIYFSKFSFQNEIQQIPNGY